MADYLTPADLAGPLGLSERTVRRAVATAETRQNQGEPLSHRDAALLAAHSTPRGFLRWTREDAIRVLRAFGKPVPAAWASPAGPSPIPPAHEAYWHSDGREVASECPGCQARAKGSEQP